jgi:propionyl-CoA carboxylase alpha chain
MEEIKKILVANRGEIAVRVMRAAREMGIATVAIYTQIDALSPHVQMADESLQLEYKQTEPYLDIDQIIEIAIQEGVDAIHPGYGFLSENADFSRKTAKSGLIFIGPHHESIKIMGDKLRAKELAREAGVPVVPGFEITDLPEEEITSGAAAVGYPILVKATAGGGGKGMRLVESEAQLHESIERAVSEAKDAFGNGSVFVEKFIQNPRHIEIQLIADQHGNYVHLFERECSVQRRHQKVIEESPSPFVDGKLRNMMGEKAIELARACGYVNAGTIEFLVDSTKNFYFLEMNTRLQVEHPVTEFITGIDLVKQQIKVAQGQHLNFQQEDLKIQGHAIELRIYAEEPENNFLPDSGKLVRYRVPKGIGVRVDDGYEEGLDVSVEYDPLIGKLIVHAADRQETIERMKRAIHEFELAGVKNTLEFGRKVMEDKDFRAGNYDTSFIEKKLDIVGNTEMIAEEATVAALLGFEVFWEESSFKVRNSSNCQSNWRVNRK